MQNPVIVSALQVEKKSENNNQSIRSSGPPHILLNHYALQITF